MAEEEKGSQQAGADSTQTDPDSGSSGESAKGTKDPSQDVPENLEGKSQTELIKMYGELERKLGEQSQTVAEAKKLRKNQEILAQAIYADPELTEQVEKNLQKVVRGEEPGSDSAQDSGKENGEADEKVTDLRRAHEDRVIKEFSDKFGLNELEQEKKQEVLKKVGAELADMVDPTGKQSVDEVLQNVKLDKLPRMLEKAFYLANMGEIMSSSDGKTESGLDFASIGRFSSSSVKQEGGETSLSDRESEIAKRLGVSPEEYLEQKKKLLAERQ